MHLSQNVLIKRTDRDVRRVVDTEKKTMSYVIARREVVQTVVTVGRMVKSAI